MRPARLGDGRLVETPPVPRLRWTVFARARVLAQVGRFREAKTLLADHPRGETTTPAQAPASLLRQPRFLAVLARLVGIGERQRDRLQKLRHRKKRTFLARDPAWSLSRQLRQQERDMSGSLGRSWHWSQHTYPWWRGRRSAPPRVQRSTRSNRRRRLNDAQSGGGRSPARVAEDRSESVAAYAARILDRVGERGRRSSLRAVASQPKGVERGRVGYEGLRTSRPEGICGGLGAGRDPVRRTLIPGGAIRRERFRASLPASIATVDVDNAGVRHGSPVARSRSNRSLELPESDHLLPSERHGTPVQRGDVARILHHEGELIWLDADLVRSRANRMSNSQIERPEHGPPRSTR